MSIDRTSVTIGIDTETGLTKKRLFIRMEASAELQYIRTYYQEWLETETGAKVNLQDLYYDTVDVPAVYHVAGSIKTHEVIAMAGQIKTPAVIVNDVVTTPEILYVGGEIITPEELYDGTEVATPENLKFTSWVNRLGNPIIIPAINSTLLTLS